MKIRPGQPLWSEVSKHLDRLLELPKADWAEQLAVLQLEQPDVAATVDELLTDLDDVEREGFLEKSLVRSTEREGPGSTIGAYTLQSLIGSGGMGEVWLAQRSDGHFEGQCAVKFLDRHAASPLGLRRFRQEGRLLAQLSHAHIARLMDAGVTKHGRPYLILEYVQGERIDQYCASRALGIEARVRLLVEVLEALAHAHSKLIIHRDIKPSNILVTPSGEVKLLDFGVAKLLSTGSGSEEEPQTRGEDFAFTPEYAAPEQVLGEAPSTATDVYQVGLMMFVLLAGRLPQGRQAGPRAERARAALEADEESLVDAAPKPLRRALRGDLKAIATRALRRLPEERYATAAALGDDLKRYLNNQPVAARAGDTGYKLGKFVRRHRGSVIGSGAVVLALIATALLALLQLRETQQQRDQSRQNARRAEMQTEFMTLMLSSAGNGPGAAEQILDAGRRLVQQHYGSDPEFQGTALLNLADRYDELGLVDKVQSVLHDADALARKLADSAMLARTQCGLAMVEIDLGHVERAASYRAAGAAALKRLQSPEPLVVETCMVAQADLADARYDHSAALGLAERALALLEQAHATHELRYFQVLQRMGAYYDGAGDTHHAFEMMRRALRAAQDSGLGDTAFALTAMHEVSAALYNFGELREACTLGQDVEERMQRAGLPVTTVMLAVRGLCLLRAGQPQRAIVWLDRAVRTALEHDEFLLQVYALERRSLGLIALGRLSAAAADLERAAALQQSHGLQSVGLRIYKSELLLARRRPQAAWEALQPALAIARDPGRGERRLLAHALLVATRIATARGKSTDAAVFATEALHEVERRARDPDLSADVGEAALLMAKCSRELHDEPGMRSAAQQAVRSLTASLGADHPLTQEALALQAGHAL